MNLLEENGGPETSVNPDSLEEAGALAVCLMPIGAEGPIVIQVARSKDEVDVKQQLRKKK